MLPLTLNYDPSENAKLKIESKPTFIGSGLLPG